MLWRDVIDLIPQIVVKNGYGEEVEQDGAPLIDVFANKKSVRQSEFYQAHADGMKPEIVFEVMTVDYEEAESRQDEGRQMKVKYNNRVYRLIRPYSANGERTELVCSIFPMEAQDGT